MAEQVIRVGDVVAVTARIVGIKGDGTYVIEPLGFDYDVEDGDGEMLSACDAVVEHYTVDEPKLVQHVWVRGDELFDTHGQRFIYHKGLGEGLHLLNRPDVPQHAEGAWVVTSTMAVASFTSDPPQLGV